MRQIKIWFEDFWPGWFNDVPGGDNFVTHCILDDVDLIVTPQDPDILFYTVFGRKNDNYRNCKRVFWTGESVRPNLDDCDLAISFDYNDHPNHVRLPLYATHWWEIFNMRKVVKHENPASLLISPKDVAKKPEKFCAFVYGNSSEGVNGWGNFQDGVVKRNDLFRLLSQYKKVDSAGTWMNNMGFRVDYMTKHDFIKDYKFTIAIENTAYPGYVTEKIIDPMSVSSVPIYWGSERVTEEFNEKSFIDCRKFSSNVELAEYIIHLDQNPEEYDKIYSRSFINSDSLPRIFDLKYMLKDKILNLLQ
jgi:hypothetical protein